MKTSGKVRSMAGTVIVGILAMQVVPASQAGTQNAAPPNTVVATQPPSAQITGNADWSRAVVDFTMKRYPNPSELGSWAYAAPYS
jgi:hypothetical protein